MYCNSVLFGLGAVYEDAYSWHIQQLTLSGSGKFVADVANMVVWACGGDIIFPDLERCILFFCSIASDNGSCGGVGVDD